MTGGAVVPERVGAVVNPVSGGGRGRTRLAELRRLLPDAGVTGRVTTGPADVRRAALELADERPRRDLLVAAGGDGTVGAVADALADRAAPPLFVLPAGRGNSAYRHWYGGADWRAVAGRLADGVRARPVDLGRVDALAFAGANRARTGVDAAPAVDGAAGSGVRAALGREHFALGLSAGLFRRAVEAADRLSGLPGPLAYLLGTARAALTAETPEVRLDADGERAFAGRAQLVAVGGGRYRGRDFQLFPAARPADGRLHALVVAPTSRREAARIARRSRTGDHVDHPAVTYRRARDLSLSAPAGLPVEVDGEPVDAPAASVDLAVAPGALSLALPAGR